MKKSCVAAVVVLFVVAQIFASDYASGASAIPFAIDPTPFADNTTPIPAALPLFASGLSALGLLGWRRKKKVAAIAA